MKKLILLIAAFFIALNHTFAQDVPVLHAIIVASTNDSTIGDAAQKSSVKFTTFLKTVADKIGYEFDEISLTGFDCKRSILDEELNDFQCDTSDIIVFCYFGHGTRSVDDKSEFPQMCFYKEPQSNYMPVEYVKNKLAKHGARITWVIGDCCNSYDEYVSSKPIDEPQSMSLSFGASANIYPMLFKKFTGVVTMCASKKGTYGWSRNDIGMHFNNALIDIINHISVNDIIPNEPWQSVMNKVQIHFKNFPIHSSKYPGQTFYMIPQYRIEPRLTKEGKSIKREHNTGIEKVLAQLSNGEEYWLEREKRVDLVMREHFSPTARYRKLTPSGTPYDGGMVKKYLQGIAHSENIANIVVLNEKRDEQGKITYMDVIEVYYENK